MRALLIAAAVLLLSSCASDGQFRTSTSFNGQSFGSMDMTDPHFYMDDDAPPSSGHAVPMQSIPRYGIDGYCGYCQGRNGWAY
jgi:outer membrane biogenesis lipoprotein LolB